MKPLPIVINPAAGKNVPVLATINDVLGEYDIPWTPMVTTKAGDAERFAARAREAKAPLVLAYGGDGTVAAVAGALVGGDTALGILPGGTGNAVAQELGIPRDLRAALVACLAEDRRRVHIDALRVGEKRHLLRVGVGADAGMVAGADRAAKDKLGWFAYLLSAMREVHEAEPARHVLELDDRRYEFDALSVIFANIGRIGRGGLHLAEDIDPTDGRMDVVVIRDAALDSVFAVGATMLGVLAAESEAGAWGDAPLLRLQARRARLRSRPVQLVHGDGEILGETPLDITVEAGAVPLLLPPLVESGAAG